MTISCCRCSIAKSTCSSITALPKYVHPEQLYIEFLRLAGELSTFSGSRLVPEFPKYDHDNLSEVFAPLLNTIQRLLSLDIGRAIRLDLTEVRANAYVANVNDRTLFSKATFIIEVAASMPLSQIQMQFPELVKVGPNTKDEGDRPDPSARYCGCATCQPRRDKFGPLLIMSIFSWRKTRHCGPNSAWRAGWPCISPANWPDLQLELWAILDDRQMSSSDDPFGANNGNKTVIRPRPGRGRESVRLWLGPASPGSTVFSNQPFGSPASNLSGPTDWVSQQSPEYAPKQAQTQAKPARYRSTSPIGRSQQRGVKTTNPITQAAVPLLVLLGRLRQLVVRHGLPCR